MHHAENKEIKSTEEKITMKIDRKRKTSDKKYVMPWTEALLGEYGMK